MFYDRCSFKQFYFSGAFIKAIAGAEVNTNGGDPERGWELRLCDCGIVKIASNTVFRDRGNPSCVDNFVEDAMAAAIDNLFGKLDHLIRDSLYNSRSKEISGEAIGRQGRND